MVANAGLYRRGLGIFFSYRFLKGLIKYYAKDMDGGFNNSSSNHVQSDKQGGAEVGAPMGMSEALAPPSPG